MDFRFDLLFAFFESFGFFGFLLFFSEFALGAFFFFFDFGLVAFFLGFGFETVFFTFLLATLAGFLEVRVRFFAAAIVALARVGPKPETAQSASTVLDAIFSQDLNPLTLSVSAVDGPMPGISVIGVGM